MSAALALLQLRGARDDVMRELDELIADAEAAAPAEAEAATTIQRCFRGSRVRARLSFMASMAIVIQRLFRGFRGRRSFATALRAKEQQARLSVFHFFATAIQRTFRGYYSRKHVHHFYARKQFIAMVAAKSDALREQLATEEMLQREEDERRREEEAVAEFKRVAKNLHHLTSTKTCPGVFNSPYLPSQMTAFNKPVEQHLKEATHELFATTGLYKRRSKKPPRRLRSTIRVSGAAAAASPSSSSSQHIRSPPPHAACCRAMPTGKHTI
eukprot:PLAT14157.2.p1 GENE.PLAT14157.2~~PLAT14157.2.p1  ORF type:complete len:270 (-),score=121.39 PLAT14157.2:330-1139(-)